MTSLRSLLLLILAPVAVVEGRAVPRIAPQLSKPFFNNNESRGRRRTPEDSPRSPPLVSTLNLLQRLRGGSTKAEDESAVRQYRLQQQLLLQSRSVLLRQALVDRGLDSLKFIATDSEEAKPVDWDCALSTEESPKSCLYSFDAQIGSKVVAPRDTSEWITMSALNRLRRTDPTKVEPLWHMKYSILDTWFDPNSPHSLYNYLSPRAALLSFVLDAPSALALAMLATFVTVFLLTFPVWEALVTNILTSTVLWMNWAKWARLIHAAFPLKLLLGQMAWKGMASVLGRFHGSVRDHLIELECQMWEGCIPRTIVEDSEEEEEEEEEEEFDDEDEDSEDEFDLR